MELWESWRLAKRIIKEHNIRLWFLELEENLNGFYMRKGFNPPVIGLSPRTLYDPVLLRCTLWEEIGHHFTVNSQPGKFIELYSLNERPADLIEEQVALRWASMRLISDDEIDQYIERRGPGLLEDFARCFAVTEEMAAERLHFLQYYNPALWRKFVWFAADYRPRIRLIG